MSLQVFTQKQAAPPNMPLFLEPPVSFCQFYGRRAQYPSVLGMRVQSCGPPTSSFLSSHFLRHSALGPGLSCLFLCGDLEVLPHS